MVYVLLGSGFEEAEALVTADLVRRADIPVTLAGIDGMTITGGHGITVVADCPIEKVTLEEGDMLVLPGGLGGVAAIEGDETAMALIGQAVEQGIYVASICAAPTILGKRGMLEGVKAVCYPGMEDEMGQAVVCPGAPAVTDGKFITGKAAGTVFEFAFAIIAALKDGETAAQIGDGVHYYDGYCE